MYYRNRGMQIFNPVACVKALLVLFAAVLMAPSALAQVTLTVEGVNNCAPLETPDACTTTTTPVNSFRWQVEEDRTYHVPLDDDGLVEFDGTGTAPAIDPNWDQPNTVSVSFHHSYMPVVMNGNATNVALLNSLDPTKNYYISVLPDAAGDNSILYSIGGAQINAGDTEVTVYVNANPIPTAQVVVFVHQDASPINAVWDLGENGLAGFAIILEDAGGKYGASAGIQSQDAFGNLLCTTYRFTDTNGNGEHDPGELFQVNGQGEPIVLQQGSGCVTGADGTVTIRNLAPAKYGVLAVPPTDSNWAQTSTIEGTKLIDAWVKANEPAFFGEFGPPGPHVSIGFVAAGPDTPYIDATVLTGGATISGLVTNLHLSRPPDTTFFNGGPFPHTTPWVGLNVGPLGEGKGIYAARTNDGEFSIPDVPPGSYQLVVWDDNMDILFAKKAVVVDAGAASCNNGVNTGCELGDVPVFQWFARMENYIYNDENENGIREEGEEGIIEQAVNLRWRDGTIYQSFPSDGDGFAPFDEVFPFFSWLVAEVDFARFKATGVTVTVDDGGPIGEAAEGSGTNWNRVLSPQAQNYPVDPDSVLPIDSACAADLNCRTEVGPVLSQGVQAFLGQTNVFEWGKKAYGPNENGGISGVVMYAVTRAEDDPEMAAAEPWEPGIPNVTINLYAANGTTLLASTTSDSWDGSRPTLCQFGSNAGSGTDEPFKFRGEETDCYDGMRNWNQVRPGVFDGGYAFGPEIDCDDFVDQATCDSVTNLVGDIRYIKPNNYVVQVIPPTGYEVIRSEDRNVDFGDTFFPSPELLPAACVGADYVVPAQLALYPGEDAPLVGQSLPLCDRKLVALNNGANAAADFSLFTEVPIAGHFIGFILDDTANEFDPSSPQFGEKYAPPFLPVSIRDWTGREISRTYSDEYGVYNALIPSTFTESLGQPSGISPNMLTTCMNAKSKKNPDYNPNRSDEPEFAEFIVDPLHNSQYSQFCYTFQYMPGSTTYLDTPVVPVAAFAGPDRNPLDCEFVTHTPRIHSVRVRNGVGGGPYAPATLDNQGETVITGNGRITIRSKGSQVEVPNPAYDGVGGLNPKTITRDYGFGNFIGTVTIGGTPITILAWNKKRILGTIPDGTKTGELVVTRGNGGLSTVTGVTVQVGLRTGSNVLVVDKRSNAPAGAYGKIQDAIQDAGDNDLILVAPGTYDELVIMWKPVQLQGWGEGSTTINAIKTPFNKLSAWRILAESLLNDVLVDLIPGQELGFGGIEPATFFSEEGAGVFVLAKKGVFDLKNGQTNNRHARIDGFTISGADTGGGITVNGYADRLEISNNRVVNNSAFFAGGVRVGHAVITKEVCAEDLIALGVDGCLEYSDAENNRVNIHHNTINQNGGLTGAGGGLAMYNGSDSYRVTDNFICGNFTTAGGAGIAHFGLSHRAGNNNNGDINLIKDNTVLFNENFNQGTTIHGGGILVEGLPGLGCLIDPVTGDANPTCLADQAQQTTPGTGSVNIYGNLVQGNSAGVGEGAGIRLARVNGQGVTVGNNGKPKSKYRIWVYNNIIVDNVAGLTGGGISLQDALAVRIWHNTIANNDNTSTSGAAFLTGTPDHSIGQPGAGIVSHGHSADLNPFVGVISTFSDPNLRNNIIWQNRKFYWTLEDGELPVRYGLCPDIGGDVGTGVGLLTCGSNQADNPDFVDNNSPVYDDLAVLDTPTGTETLNCRRCVMTDDITNVAPQNAPEDPLFVSSYVNGARNDIIIVEGTTGMNATPAFDEGGNFIRLRFGPLTLTDPSGNPFGDYHIQGASPAKDIASGTRIKDDFDGEPRSPVDANNVNDIGADEIQPY